VKIEIIQFDAEINNILFVRNFLKTLGTQYRLSKSMIFNIQLAVEEAVTNIIRHGYQSGDGGEIRIEIIIRHFLLKVVIIDRGKEFDLRQIDKPDLMQYVQIGKIGGLGILMIRNLIDKIDYKVTDRGNELYLVKYRKNVTLFNIYYVFELFLNLWKRIFTRKENGNISNNTSLGNDSVKPLNHTSGTDRNMIC
jgi:anti-sigma regulatory factor (Ser/Thr protein kinase)